ncbi:UNVERIFIED_CONTAM: putative ribonuclease H protein, partial [Sesamum indicum]
LRNDAEHRGVEFKANTIIHKTLAYLHNLYKSELLKSEHVQGDFFAVNTINIPLQPKTKRQKAFIVHWRKPQEGWYKLNTNGASKGNPGISSAGGILRAHLGQVIFAFQEPLGITSNTQAELRAIHRGLKICIEKGFHNIWIETDAMVIIKLISSPRQGAWDHQITLQSIRKLLRQIEYKISHIFREGNQVAAFLANQVCTSQQLSILTKEHLPSKVKDIVNLDSCGLPHVRLKIVVDPS